jgi:hypothetical protein
MHHGAFTFVPVRILEFSDGELNLGGDRNAHRRHSWKARMTIAALFNDRARPVSLTADDSCLQRRQ